MFCPPMLLSSTARISCSCCTVICKVSCKFWLLFWTLFPITAKLLVKSLFSCTQQPAVHNEFGTEILPVLSFPIWLMLAITPTTWLFCRWILTKEVPVKRYRVPETSSPCRPCMGCVHVCVAYTRILFSNADHAPVLKFCFCGTAFVYV